jgi:hypothetical protein
MRSPILRLSFQGQQVPNLLSISSRNFSTYKFDSLVKWIEDEGKSLLNSPGLKDPRSRWRHCFKYLPLSYQGKNRKKMLETATVRWIGGALHGLNTRNGKYEAYAIVGGSGTGKTRFLGEMIDNWEHWRALSRKISPPGAEIPPSTLVFPISFNSSTSVTPGEEQIVDILIDTYKISREVTSTYQFPIFYFNYCLCYIFPYYSAQ